MGRADLRFRRESAWAPEARIKVLANVENTRNANIAQHIFEDLRRQILGGELSPGERLLGERELATRYGTNRNTLREAVRKLEQTRLVSVRHGRGVSVTDFRRAGTLELLSPYLQSGPD